MEGNRNVTVFYAPYSTRDSQSKPGALCDFKFSLNSYLVSSESNWGGPPCFRYAGFGIWVMVSFCWYITKSNLSGNHKHTIHYCSTRDKLSLPPHARHLHMHIQYSALNCLYNQVYAHTHACTPHTSIHYNYKQTHTCTNTLDNYRNNSGSLTSFLANFRVYITLHLSVRVCVRSIGGHGRYNRLIVDARCITMPTKPHTSVLCLKIRVLASYSSFSVKCKKMDGIDRNAISPSLFNPAYGELTKYVYNPGFDLRVGADFFDGLMPHLYRWLQRWKRTTPWRKHWANSKLVPVCVWNCLCLKLKRVLSLVFASIPGPMQDSTNGNATGSSSRFAKPVTSPECEKAGQGVIPSNTEANI